MKKYLIFNKIPIHNIKRSEFVNFILASLKKKKKTMVCYLNVHNIVQALSDTKYREALNKAHVVYSDGWGPVLAGSIFGQHIPERVNAADFIDGLLNKLSKKKVKLYLLGDTKQVVLEAAKKIKLKYPFINIVGLHDGFFSKTENLEIIKEITSKKPNLVLIGMGQPKQEYWVNNNYSKLPNTIYWCVGGLFNYIAGKRKRAPLWIRENGLEWVYRLFQEPRRLMYRYTIENLIFSYALFKYWLSKLFRKEVE